MTLFTYRATVLRVIDGDTLECLFDLGFHTLRREVVRLLGIDCPEKNSAGGKDALRYTQAWVEGFGGDVVIQTVRDKREKYGRYLGIVMGELGGIPLNDCLLIEGLATKRLE